MENKYYYGFKCIFDFSNTNINIFNSNIEYLDVGFTYLGYIVRNRFHKYRYLKYYIDVEYIINMLIKEFDRLMKNDEIFKYIKLDYDVMYKELEIIIKDKINQYSDLVEEI